MSFLPLGISLFLLVACYWRTLSTLTTDWVRVDTARHGFAVLLFVIALIWRSRAKLASLPRTPFGPGFVLIAWGGAQALAASLGVELFLGRTAFLIALAGVVLFQLGLKFSRELAAPWLLLWLSVPLPAIVYNPLVGALQAVASAVAESLLSMANIPLRWEGASMQFAGGSEQVRLIDAFGGLRLAMALVAGAVAYGVWMKRRLWVRFALVGAVMVLAIALGALRIVAVASLDEAGSTGWALRILEHVGPWTMAAVCLIALGYLDWVLDSRRRRAAQG